MESQIQPQEWYRAQFALFEQSLNGGASAPVHALRKGAVERFLAMGFPTTRMEDWRFTNLTPITRLSPAAVLARPRAVPSASELSRFLPADGDSPCLVFVNGHFVPELSRAGVIPGGARVRSLAAEIAGGSTVAVELIKAMEGDGTDAFSTLNTAFLRDGALVMLPDGVSVDVPVHLVFLSTPESGPFFSLPRNLIVAGKGSRVSVVEHYAGLGQGSYLTNAVTQITVGDGATVEHDKLQEEGTDAFHVGTTFVRMGRESVMTSNSIAFGGSIVRNTVTALLEAEGSECTLNGLTLATGRQLVDNHTSIDHAKPQCASHELYKSILDGNSRGVFNGKIFVRKDAQKTDAKQTNKTLLLSDEATIDTKPQLEIFADDVKCTHGAAIGQLDEEQLFYLRTRGIDLESARDMLTYAFATDVIQRVRSESVRGRLEGLLRSRLRMGRIAQGNHE